MVADFDTSGVESGAQRVESSLDGITQAEKRANETTKESVRVTNEASNAEREHAAAIDRVRSALDPAYASQKRANELLKEATRLAAAGAISKKELAQAELLHTRAMQGQISSLGAQRAAYASTAFQIQDITQSLALGINPMVVFGQQAGQLASSLAGTANSATVLGRVIGFLASPAGSVIIGAITVLGLFYSALSKSKEGSEDLSDALDFQRMSHQELTKAIREQTKEAEQSIQTGYQQISMARDLAKANLDAALAERKLLAAEQERANIAAANAAGESSRASANAAQRNADRAIAENQTQIDELERVLRLKEIPIIRREAEAATDKAAASTLRYEAAEAFLNAQLSNGLLTLEAHKLAMTSLLAARKKDAESIREQEREQKKLNKETQKAGELASFISPISGGRVTSGLSSARRNPVTGKVQAHNGIDIAAGFGTAVSAPQVGVVKAVGYSSTLGKYVVIDHGAGTTTRYGHLSDNSFVREGDAVSQGQRIGSVGSTGRSTGNHLHYEVLVNGKPVDPGKGKFLIDDVKIAEQAEKAAAALKEFGDRAGESIARVSERFDEQPRLIDQAAQATRQLDDIIAELGTRKPINWEEMVKDAKAAKLVIADALLRPFDDLEEASQRRMDIERLIAANREDEAEALQIIYGLEEKLGPITDERKNDVIEMVARERELSEVLSSRKEILDAYLGASRAIRGEVEAILSGQGKLSNFKQIFKNLQGKVLTEQLFGGIFRDFDKWVKEETAISSSVDLMKGETERAGVAASDFADALNDETAKVNGSTADSGLGIAGLPGSSSAVGLLKGFSAYLGKARAGGGTGTPTADGELVVTALKGGVNGLSPERYFEEMSRRLTRPLLDGLDSLLGTKFFSGLDGVVSGGITGVLTGGIPGGIIGALKGIKGLPEGIAGALDKAGKGAQTGTMVAGLGDALGIKNSKLGAQLGGAAGSFLPIPGGDIIGAIAGGLIGGLFKKTKYGTANVTGADAISAAGRGKGRVEGATTLGGGVTDGLRNIADALDAELGSFNVSIGTYKDSFRVSGSGKTGKLKGGDVKDFGDDQAAAMAYAIADAIADGAIKGISPAVAAALRSNSDIDKAVAEAVKVKDLELQIRRLDDPIAGLFDSFLATAKERVELARKYGLDLNKVEKLNAKEREAIIDDAIERSVGGLKALLKDLDYGSLFEGSPVERRAAIRKEIEDAKADVTAGVDGAGNRLADLERQLVETSRNGFGTAGPEYAADLAEARSTAEQIIKEEERRIREAAEATKAGLDLANETNDLLSGTNGRLDTVIGLLGGYEGGYTPRADATAAAQFDSNRYAVKLY